MQKIIAIKFAQFSKCVYLLFISTSCFSENFSFITPSISNQGKNSFQENFSNFLRTALYILTSWVYFDGKFFWKGHYPSYFEDRQFIHLTFFFIVAPVYILFHISLHRFHINCCTKRRRKKEEYERKISYHIFHLERKKKEWKTSQHYIRIKRFHSIFLISRSRKKMSELRKGWGRNGYNRGIIFSPLYPRSRGRQAKLR